MRKTPKASRVDKMVHRVSGVVRTVLAPIANRMLLTWENLESGMNYDPTVRAVMAAPYILYETMLEAWTVLARLLERFSSIRLESEPAPRLLIALRGVEDLRVEVER